LKFEIHNSRPDPQSASPAPSEWWASFFSGLAVEFWRAAVPEEATRAEADFLWRHLRLSPSAAVLDVPCGAGRLTVPLAERGGAMTGVDISEEFLAAARERARGSSASIEWRRSDMRDLPWTGRFDAAFCFGNSFGYLDDAGNAAFLAATARALVPGARLALDYGQAAESILPRLQPRLEAEIAGFRFVEETRYDFRAARIENRFTISRGEETETKLASQRVYTVRELLALLESAGFRPFEIYGSSREEPYALGSPNLIVVAERV
jgi:SAM-dependent methyltransferase